MIDYKSTNRITLLNIQKILFKFKTKNDFKTEFDF